MEAEHELALRVSAFVELFWYPDVPTSSSKTRYVKKTDYWDFRFADLFPSYAALEKLRSYETETGDIDKPLLRRAAKAAGLWTDDDRMEFATRYVAVREDKDSHRSKARRLDLSGGQKGEISELQGVAKRSRELLVSDRTELEEIFEKTVFHIPNVNPSLNQARTDVPIDIPNVKPSLDRARTDVPIDIEQVQQAIAELFYSDPNVCERVASALDYAPSFTWTLARAVMDSTRSRGRAWKRRGNRGLPGFAFDGEVVWNLRERLTSMKADQSADLKAAYDEAAKKALNTILGANTIP